MEVELKAVLYRGAVDFGDQSTCLGHRSTVEACPLSDREKLVRGLPRKPSAATAHMDAKFVLHWGKPTLQGTDYARRDTGRMPVHPHNGAERLEPKRMSEAAEQLVTSVVM